MRVDESVFEKKPYEHSQCNVSIGYPGDGRRIIVRTRGRWTKHTLRSTKNLGSLQAVAAADNNAVDSLQTDWPTSEQP